MIFEGAHEAPRTDHPAPYVDRVGRRARGIEFEGPAPIAVGGAVAVADSRPGTGTGTGKSPT